MYFDLPEILDFSSCGLKKLQINDEDLWEHSRTEIFWFIFGKILKSNSPNYFCILEPETFWWHDWDQ